MKKLKSISSPYPLDLPSKLRKEYDIFLCLLLQDIFNSCLYNQIYPDPWKVEYVTPINKCPVPQELSHLRKIASTSEYSKLLESFLKDWILEDIEDHLDVSQYGGRKGSGTEHLIVCYVDRVLKLLDSTTASSAVIAAAADFVSAFDKTDPSRTAQCFINLGIRSSLIPILISYMSGRKIIVRFKGSESFLTTFKTCT